MLQKLRCLVTLCISISQRPPSFFFFTNLPGEKTSQIFTQLVQTCKNTFFYTTQDKAKFNLAEKKYLDCQENFQKVSQKFKIHKKNYARMEFFSPKLPQIPQNKFVNAKIHLCFLDHIKFWIGFNQENTNFTGPLVAQLHVFAHSISLWFNWYCNIIRFCNGPLKLVEAIPAFLCMGFLLIVIIDS